MAIYNPQVGLTVPSIAPAPLVGVGAGLQDAGQAFQVAAERQQVVDVSKALADTKLRWTQELLKRQNDAAPGAAGFSAGIGSDFDADVNQQRAQFKGKARDYFDVQVAQLKTNVMSDAGEFEIKERNADLVRKAQDTIDTQINTVRTDPRQYDSASAQLDGLFAGLHMPPRLVADLRNKTQERLSAAVVQAKIDQNPEEAIKALESGQYDAVIKPETKNTLLEQAQRAADRNLTRALAWEARQDRQADKVLKQAADDAEKVLAQKSVDHELTRDDVEKMRPFLKPDAYTKYVNMASGGTWPDDPHTFQTLSVAATNTPTDQFQSQLTAAFNQKLIKPETYRSLLDANIAANKDDGPGSAFKSSRKYIEDTLNPSVFETGASHAFAAAALGNALRDFDKWARANPGAAPDEMDGKAREIVKSYATINLTDSDLARPIPPYVSFTKQNIATMDPDAALAELQDAGLRIAQEIESGTRTKAEGADLLQVIDGWTRSFELRRDMNAEQAERKKKGKK